MGRFLNSASLLLAGTLLLISSCTGRAGDAGAQFPAASEATSSHGSESPAALAAVGLDFLPAPSSFNSPAALAHRTSATPGESRSEAESFTAGLPNSRVAAAANTLDFAAEWAPGDLPSGLAYAGYEFILPDFDLGNALVLHWDNVPLPASAWVGLSDWQRDSWRWYAPVNNSRHVLPADMGRHFADDGRLLVIVLLTGEQTAALDWLSIGNQSPEAVIEVTGPRLGWMSLSTSFSAANSYDLDGPLVKYEWDWDSDGIYDALGVEAAHVFSEAGVHTVRLRVTDELGRTDGAPVDVSVAAPWMHTLGGAGDEYIGDIEVAADGTLWACGFAASGPASNELALLQFDAAGSLLKELYWKVDSGATAKHEAHAMSIGADGNVYIVGRLESSQHNGSLLQCYSRHGDLLWREVFDSAQGQLYDIVATENLIYVCGSRQDETLGGPRGLYFAMDPDGNPLFAYLSQASAEFRAAAWHDSGGLGDELRMCGFMRDALADYDLLHAAVVYGEVHTSNAQSWGSAEWNELGVALELKGETGSVQSAMALSIGKPLENKQFSSVVLQGVNVTPGVTVDNSYMQPRDLAYLGTNEIFLLSGDSSLRSLIMEFELPQLVQTYGNTDGISSLPSNLAVYGTDVLAVGGSTAAQNTIFDEPLLGETTDFSNSWEDYALTFEPIVVSVQDVNLANISQRPPGVLDSGGGGFDFWLGLHQPPQAEL